MRDIKSPGPLAGGNRAGFAVASMPQPYTRTPPETQVEPDWSVPRFDAVDLIAAQLVRAHTGGQQTNNTLPGQRHHYERLRDQVEDAQRVLADVICDMQEMSDARSAELATRLYPILKCLNECREEFADSLNKLYR